MNPRPDSADALSRSECLRLLARSTVGRVVVTQKALPAAFPVGFALLDEDVVFVAPAGSALELAAADAVVAFEADEVDPVGHTGWSVLVQGWAAVIVDADDLARARALPLEPWPSGTAVRFVRIRSELVSGRRLFAAGPHQGAGTTGRMGGGQDPQPVQRSGFGRPFAGCPSCGSDRFLPVSNGRTRNFVCNTCAACWHLEHGELRRVQPDVCPGCSFLHMCTAAAARDGLLTSIQVRRRS